MLLIPHILVAIIIFNSVHYIVSGSRKYTKMREMANFEILILADSWEIVLIDSLLLKLTVSCFVWKLQFF